MGILEVAVLTASIDAKNVTLNVCGTIAKRPRVGSDS
jgi:hypothetical protein